MATDRRRWKFAEGNFRFADPNVVLASEVAWASVLLCQRVMPDQSDRQTDMAMQWSIACVGDVAVAAAVIRAMCAGAVAAAVEVVYVYDVATVAVDVYAYVDGVVDVAVVAAVVAAVRAAVAAGVAAACGAGVAGRADVAGADLASAHMCVMRLLDLAISSAAVRVPAIVLAAHAVIDVAAAADAVGVVVVAVAVAVDAVAVPAASVTLTMLAQRCFH